MFSTYSTLKYFVTSCELSGGKNNKEYFHAVNPLFNFILYSTVKIFLYATIPAAVFYPFSNSVNKFPSLTAALFFSLFSFHSQTHLPYGIFFT